MRVICFEGCLALPEREVPLFLPKDSEGFRVGVILFDASLFSLLLIAQYNSIADPAVSSIADHG